MTDLQTTVARIRARKDKEVAARAARHAEPTIPEPAEPYYASDDLTWWDSQVRATEPAPEYVVYEHSSGIPWSVDPPTQENAEHERDLLIADGSHPGEYAVMTKDRATELRNAFAHGRMHGHAQAKEQAALRILRGTGALE